MATKSDLRERTSELKEDLQGFMSEVDGKMYAFELTVHSTPRAAFDEDPFLRDIAERNLEIAAQRCIDIAQRIIALEDARKPSDYLESILILAELGIISGEFARRFAPIAALRNVLVHEDAGINWDKVYARLQDLSDLDRFRESALNYMRR